MERSFSKQTASSPFGEKSSPSFLIFLLTKFQLCVNILLNSPGEVLKLGFLATITVSTYKGEFFFFLLCLLTNG